MDTLVCLVGPIKMQIPIVSQASLECGQLPNPTTTDVRVKPST